MAESPNYFTTAHVMTTCGADVPDVQAETFAFGFPATGLRVYNSCGPRLFYNLQGAATTVGDFLACGAVLELPVLPPFGGLSLKTTSTSTTGGAVARPFVGIAAWAASA